MSKLFCLFYLPKVIVKEICKVRQQTLKNMASSVGFQWLWHPQTGKTLLLSIHRPQNRHILSYKSHYHSCLYNVFNIQILAHVCEICTISKFLPSSVDCVLYSNSCPCLWSVLYSNSCLLFVHCALYSLVQTTFLLVLSMLIMGQLSCWGSIFFPGAVQ